MEKLTMKVYDEPRLEDKTNCEHSSYCQVRKFGKINCMDKYSCETYKAYEDVVNNLFIEHKTLEYKLNDVLDLSREQDE